VEILEQAKKIGLRTASISSDPLGPLAICSDTYITIPWNPLSFIDSFTAPMSILNCVLLETARILGPKAQEKLEKLEALWQENNVYTS
jgi:DNA-binding MurR/RpiR family transcriptional regulator